MKKRQAAAARRAARLLELEDATAQRVTPAPMQVAGHPESSQASHTVWEGEQVADPQSTSGQVMEGSPSVPILASLSSDTGIGNPPLSSVPTSTIDLNVHGLDACHVFRESDVEMTVEIL